MLVTIDHISRNRSFNKVTKDVQAPTLVEPPGRGPPEKYEKEGWSQNTVVVVVVVAVDVDVVVVRVLLFDAFVLLPRSVVVVPAVEVEVVVVTFVVVV